MANYEFNIHVAKREIGVYVSNGFFYPALPSTSSHMHRYTEVHLNNRGTISYLIGTEHFTLNEGHLLIIPPQSFHRCYPTEEKTECMIFQIDIAFSEPTIISFIPEVFTALQKECQLAQKTGNLGKLPQYLALICSAFLPNSDTRLHVIQDRGFIIHEYLSHNYQDNISLSDLAKELNLSNKQTERMMQKYVGNTFRQELSRMRIQAAKHLLASGELSLKEVASQVGFHSYSGFWKAFRDTK